MFFLLPQWSDKIIEAVTVVAVALPQTQAVVDATAPFVESVQFNAFDTTRTTFASSPSFSSSSSSSSSWSPLFLPSSSSSSFEGTGVYTTTQQKFSSPYLTSSSLGYPTSTTTISGLHNTKSSRIMSSINSISPTLTTTIPRTTFKTSSTKRSSNSANVGINGYSLDIQLHGSTKQSTLNSYAHTTTSGYRGGTPSVASSSGMSSFKNIMKSKGTITASNGKNSKSASSSIYSSNQQEQQFPLDFTFSKNHWTNSGEYLSTIRF